MRQRHKFLVTLLVVGAALVLILWNTSAQSSSPSIGVTEAKRDAERLSAVPVQVRGVVVEGSIVSNESLVDSFVLADQLEQLHVEFGQVPPDNFGPKEVVVAGTIRVDPDGTVVLVAKQIQVGCSSKY